MQRVLLVSNRLPVTIEKRKGTLNIRQSVGGLATGLNSFHQEHESLWIGWCGLASDTIDAHTRRTIESTLKNDYLSIPTFLSSKDIRQFYSGFCNKTIWPLFHYFSNYAIYNNKLWESYRHVNRLFAQTIKQVAQPDDIIWIHDYHLFLLPRMLREHCPDTQIGFFLHIPFPSYEVFRLLPWRKELLDGLLGSDLIGFHTYDYVRHFMSSVRRVLGYEHTFDQLTVDNRIIKVDAFPMGIDYQRFADASCETGWLSEVKSRCKTQDDCRIIISIDRLDYTKGIPQRLKAFDHFLDMYPEYKSRVTLIMLAVPTRTTVVDYRNLKQYVDELVGRINGKHGTIDWMPIWYLYRSLPFEKVVSLYNIADVALVTPLRDGMNLVAKEYIAARKDGLGVLILSEMAGAVREMGEAIIVNPNSMQDVAEAIYEALIMPESEQVERNAVMKKRLSRYDITTWQRDFISSLDKLKVQQDNVETKKLTRKHRSELIEHYAAATNRLILLDYDGTLIPFTKKPEKAKPDRNILYILHHLATDPNNLITIISGRDRETLDHWFGELHIGLSAEHGVWLKDHNEAWHLLDFMQNDWKEEIRPTIETFVDRTPGSFCEEKTYSLTWHYRQVSHEQAFVRTRELIEKLLHMTENKNLMVLKGNKVIEVKTAGINKGRAARHWIDSRKWDFIMAVGDDWTDEDLFDVLPEKAYSIKVGMGISKAKYYCTNVMDVRNLLAELMSAGGR